jgi:hypothetical protein
LQFSSRQLRRHIAHAAVVLQRALALETGRAVNIANQ